MPAARVHIALFGLVLLGFTSIAATQQLFVVDSHSPSTCLNIASFNIRYSNDATYDSAWSKLQAIKQVLTGGKRQKDLIEPLAAGANPSLPTKNWGERSWFLRGPRIVDQILFHDWDVFGLQEVLDAQYTNLIQWIGDEYDHVGAGRDDGKRAGEAVPLFWKREKFARVSGEQGGVGKQGYQHFWLSTTPEKVGSVGWDADLTRMCTHVALRLRETGEIVHFFSTHYDHKGLVAREESSKLILKKAREANEKTKQWARQNGKEVKDSLVVLVGDLNSPRNEASWTALVGGHYAIPGKGPSFLDVALSVPTRMTSPYLNPYESEDDQKLASGQVQPPTPNTNVTESQAGSMYLPYGPLRTFTNFEPSQRSAIEDRIDFIMLLDNDAVKDETRKDAVLKGTEGKVKQERQSGMWRVRTYGVVSSWSHGDAGFLVSDHRAVMTRIQRS